MRKKKGYSRFQETVHKSLKNIIDITNKHHADYHISAVKI